MATVLAWPSSSPNAATFTGYIEVNNSSTFIGNAFNAFGEYITTTTLANALTVSFDPSTSVFSITETNNPASASFPFVGAIQGFPDSSPNLGSGNSNFTYLGGTSATALGATPAAGTNSFTSATGISEAIESDIWSISSSDVLTAQWTNTNSSRPTTDIITSTAQGNEVLLTGDPTAFSNSFGSETTDTLIFVCTTPGGCPLPSAAVPEPSSALLTLAPLALLTIFRSRRCQRGDSLA
jgi:hypothetical protein